MYSMLLATGKPFLAKSMCRFISYFMCCSISYIWRRNISEVFVATTTLPQFK